MSEGRAAFNGDLLVFEQEIKLLAIAKDVVVVQGIIFHTKLLKRVYYCLLAWHLSLSFLPEDAIIFLTITGDLDGLSAPYLASYVFVALDLAFSDRNGGRYAISSLIRFGYLPFDLI